MALSYREQLQHPNWDKKVKEILERDDHCCLVCGSNLHRVEVHHLCYYPDHLAWEYDNELYVTLCNKHHDQITYDMPKLSGLIAFEALRNNIDLNSLYEVIKSLKK